MLLGAQYYRPPFPRRDLWRDDLRAMRNAGLNTVQLWACWGWIEPEPGVYRFDDYDELVEIARETGLNVVISTVAEIQPFWIHRVVPDSQMVDHLGQRVVSSLRHECNVGLTPGGCTDHPDVARHMGAFLRTIASRYASVDHLVGWDCWNELRWAIQSDNHACYCPHTLRAYRDWLDQRHGGLDGVSSAFKRRYSAWEDVVPGKLPRRPYTDLLEFQAFLTDRATRHAAFRYQHLRSGDQRHTVLAHGAFPSTFAAGVMFEQALSRGNDWELADVLDGMGCSHFPIWFSMSNAELGARYESVGSAARGKTFWVSELQGGGVHTGLAAGKPVPADTQQRWVWSGYARGAKAVLFWCWRDEVFGEESGSFGLIGDDGHAPRRIEALQRAGALLTKHAKTLDAYQPDRPQVGVFFDPHNYQLDWAQYGSNRWQAARSVQAYAKCLERAQIPYTVIEAGHLDLLADLKVLLLAWPMIVRPAAAEKIAQWVRQGGTLLVEPELDAFDALGFYRYPDERPLAAALGFRERGRREVPTAAVTYDLGAQRGQVALSGWLTEQNVDGADKLGALPTGETFLSRRSVGQGQVFVVSGHAGLAYEADRASGLEDLVRGVVTAAGAEPPVECNVRDGETVQWRLGTSDDQRVLFILNGEPESPVTVWMAPRMVSGCGDIEDLAGGVVTVQQDGGRPRIEVRTGCDGYAVLRWPAQAG